MILTSARGVRQDINELRGEVGTLRERMAHLEGLMEGLREAIVGRGQSQLGARSVGHSSAKVGASCTSS